MSTIQSLQNDDHDEYDNDHDDYDCDNDNCNCNDDEDDNCHRRGLYRSRPGKHDGCFAHPACRAILWCILCFVIFFGIVIGILVLLQKDLLWGTTQGQQQGQDGDTNNNNDTATPAPTIIYDVPEYDPNLLGQPLIEILPEDTLLALEDPASPQTQAFDWLQQHPQRDELANWKKLQLLALATIYHAFHGDNWPEQKKRHWLDYDQDECQWGDPTTDEYFGNSCHDNGRFKSLHLDWFLGHSIGGFASVIKGTHMPGELQFLTALESLGILNAGCQATLEDLLPYQLTRIPTLQQISFKYNRLNGTLPMTLIDMTSLTYLSVGNNFITGAIPPELGSLTNMNELFLYGNHLEGSLPSTLGRLTNMTGFSAIHNQLTGSIPEEIQSWTRLQWFYVDHNNRMTGTVPDALCDVSNITSILIDCSVECPVDCSICECYQ
jgi:hypothetical protein